MTFSTKLVKCLGCGKQVYLYRTKSPHAKSLWYRENPDGKRHHCLRTETAAQKARRGLDNKATQAHTSLGPSSLTNSSREATTTYTRLPPETTTPCHFCHQPIFLRRQAPGFKSRWT